MGKNIKTTMLEYIKESSDDTLLPDYINKILDGYIECALWTEEEELTSDSDVDIDDDDDDMDDIEKIIKFGNKSSEPFTADDIDGDSKVQAYLDIKKFIKEAGNDAIKEAVAVNGLHRLGMDIWYTRNGHGAGFFDHGYDNEEALMSAGRNLGETSLYIGDDGKLHFGM